MIWKDILSRWKKTYQVERHDIFLFRALPMILRVLFHKYKQNARESPKFVEEHFHSANTFIAGKLMT